ncbi:hypothetical protein HYFRA_00004469 [Hymenoscyphus fraxineus]|uniref:Heterokaryon incompatibility domain-containing protein n=1 Tax=Hymenoscyphus fraxineus TaxID=746836 RepID=A0A9N9KXT4_9HELO|nr:hypothetical protein HYFRA_00004469 [Hymenoscyphus fraxineus]
MFLDGPALERSSKALQKSEDTLKDYVFWRYFDDDIKALYGVLLELTPALQYLKATLAQEVDWNVRDATVKSLESHRKAVSQLPSRLHQIRSEDIYLLPERSSSSLQIFEDREKHIDTFRTRIRRKLHKNVLEFRQTVPSVLEDLDLAIHIFEKKLLKSRLEQWPDNQEPLPILKLPPLQSSGRLSTCNQCSKIFELRELWPINDRLNPFQPSISFKTDPLKLFDSAARGCHFCRLQIARLLDLGPAIADIKMAHVTWWKYWVPGGEGEDEDDEEGEGENSFCRDFRIRYMSRRWTTICWDYFVTRTLAKEDKVRLIASSTDSRTSMALARTWIRNCVNNHDDCHQNPSKSSRRPTRLIFLGKAATTVEPRLVEEKNIGMNVRYMTLSHRWNKQHPAKLSTTNYSGLIQRIPLNPLPRVFLDAMMIARRLGIFYLWIDSLCIMQDSLEDWQSESSHMADIYAGSWCNISAMSGQDNLHVERNPLEIQGCLFKDKTANTTFQVRAHDEGFRQWNQSITKSPLMKRGWVLQELSVAPRTLHFGLDRVFFQCKTQKASEASPTNLDITVKRYQPAPLSLTLPFKQHWGPPGWAELIHQYTRRTLTFPEKDKLVAISGLAQNHGPSEQYLAGLWKKDIIFQLPWRVLHDPGLSSPQSNSQTPTWTWASTNHPVLSNSHPESKSLTLHPLATFLRAEIIPVSEDAYGQISKGTLYLEAPLIEVSFEPLNPNAYTARWYRGGALSLPIFSASLSSSTRSISFDSLPNLPITPSSTQPPQDPPPPTPSSSPKSQPQSADQEIKDKKDQTPTYLLPLYYHLSRTTKRKTGLQALIVQPTGLNEREFVRKGVVYIEGAWWVANLGRCCRDFLGAVEGEIYEGLVGEREDFPLYEVVLV